MLHTASTVLIRSACVLLCVGLMAASGHASNPRGHSPVSAHAPQQLWPRLKGTFRLSREYEREDVQRWARDFASRPHEIRVLVGRARPYLYHIVERIEREDIPGEIALIPFLESGFDPFAYSSGDAAGMWQFVEATGDRFGLKRSWWYDGRRDVLASTEAAIAYLHYLQQRYHDWPTSMAAYNAGEGRVWGAIRRNSAAGEPIDFWSLPLPSQTQAYVPRILGLAAVFANPEQYGIVLPRLNNSAETQIIAVPGQIDLDLAAELADMNSEWIHRLNPGFNRFATDPDGPHTLLIPTNRARKFATSVHRLSADQRVRWEHHTVASGQTLSQIAEQTGAPQSVIQQINRLPDARLRAGQVLRLPKVDASLALAEETERRQRATTRHTVRAGESLWVIARRYGVTVRRLARFNGISTTATIRPRQVLKVPGGGASRTYTVRAGDSLSEIAQRFGVSSRALSRANGIRRPDLIRPGQTLTIPRQNGA